MSEQLKKRMTGAVVLVALAAIFVPMLFNNGEQTQMPTFGSNVPAQPHEPFHTIEVPLQIPPEQTITTRPITTQREATTYEAQTASRPASVPSKGHRTGAPVASARSSDSSPSIKPAANKDRAPRATKPVAVSKPDGGWVVQLGSFGKSANALALRDKIRKKGYAAFVEQQRIPQGMIYRVRVGPEIKRERADALKGKLAKAGFKGVVMPHP